ncbi:MAG: hypothetical protein DRR16_07330 [Candidatus Parabeggiatoa sp. nov. 3]|nr:MAG: hypothetical protein DRR00_10460 [Gammaproteobacteria bacterium]RKZ65117.1 MAG: hypothetical protein DRQ99_13655 [Gammaproteobacteria bacterium]RKZ87432.1 MAG: hypothetical protein DRR16_07330 [Gammaproteobacteria bacterium]
MTFNRIITFGDMHGDLDILLASLAEKGLIRYEQKQDDIIEQIKAGLNDAFIPSLEAIVIPQSQPVRVVFLGDFLDRYDFGYAIIQFLQKIRWETFEIYPIFILSNHDLLNFHFVINPFELPEIYQGSGHDKEDTVAYIQQMGVNKSLDNFKALHGDEIVSMQQGFYETGKLEYQEAGYTLLYQYPCDLSALVQPRLYKKSSFHTEYNNLVNALGLGSEKCLEEGKNVHLADAFFNLVGELTENEPRNWWDLSHTQEAWQADHGILSRFNLFKKEIDKDTLEIFLVDWRVISLIWRHHYGDFFRRTQLLHNEGNTVFVHGGISPLAMLDPLVFGSLYDPRSNTFKALRPEYKRDLSLEKMISRTNRVVAQIMENALNDYSFRRMNGLEVIDQMGFWRGIAQGFPSFGGPVWSDFDYLQHCLKGEDKLRELYQAFKEATGIDRIICGHTQFQLLEKPDVRYLMIKELQESCGLEYLCVDNACSRGYRHDKPVLNGIEIDQDGKIQSLGEIRFSSW